MSETYRAGAFCLFFYPLLYKYIQKFAQTHARLRSGGGYKAVVGHTGQGVYLDNIYLLVLYQHIHTAVALAVQYVKGLYGYILYHFFHVFGQGGERYRTFAA